MFYLYKIPSIENEEKPAPIIFGDESLSDVSLVVDNQDFKTNKMVLANRSDVFKAMFFGNFKEAKEDRVEIKDVPVENFRRFLEIVYTGKTADRLEFLPYPFIGDGQDHKPLAPNTKLDLEKYWKDTTELLNIADRFNLTPMVKDHFGSVIIAALHRCRKTDCFRCFNGLIFALVNEIDVSECTKKYLKSLFWEWVNFAREEPFPDMNKKTLSSLSQHLD